MSYTIERKIAGLSLDAVEVNAIDPVASMQAIDNAGLKALVAEVR